MTKVKNDSDQIGVKIGTNLGTIDESWKSLFVSPLNIEPITSSKLIVDFTKVDPVQKFQIGEAFLSFTK